MTLQAHWSIVAALVALAPACRGGGTPEKTEAAAAAHEHEHEGHAAEAAGDHGGHHAEGEEPGTSDLDRPVDELFAASCEHGKKTFECDECRYEVGVVRVAGDLRADGLIQTATIGRAPMDTAIALTGEIRFDERRVTHLAPRTEGVIRRIHVTLGQQVTEGQPLVELESVALGEAASDLLEALATLDLARRSHDREAELRARQISSERDYLAARRELESAEIRVRGAREKLARLGLTAGEIKAIAAGRAGGTLGRVVMRAPAAGTILSMHAVPGEVTRAEESLLLIGDPSSLWLWADLYERDLAEVLEHKAQGDLRAVVTVKAFPDAEFPGTVDFVEPTMDQSTRTVKLRVLVNNPDGKLRAGMFASMKLYLPGGGDVLAMPESALLADEGRSFAFVHHHDDYYVRRPLTIGRRWPGWVEITGGLSEGQTVVTEGCFLLKSDVLRSKMGAGCAD